MKMGPNKVKLSKILAACFLALPVLIIFSVIYPSPPIGQARDFQEKADRVDQQSPDLGDYSQLGDKFLHGLLVPGFDEESCLSRYQSASYRKAMSYHEASPYLLSQLRRYENLHKRCGPHTKLYNETAKLLISGQSSCPMECQYVVWAKCGDLPNKMLTLVSAFLYALITNRVLLVERGNDVADLFCEPFPSTSWLLPADFPILNQFKSLGQNSSHCYGNMKKHGVIDRSKESFLSFLYLHLVHDYGDHDKMFFCEHEQALLAKVPWLIMKADDYFVPSLFLIPSFQRELGDLFPVKGTVFHQLGRYLFHPTNKVWGLITRYYQAYLAKAEETLGIQIKVFDDRPERLPHLIDQILACTRESKLLPEINKHESIIYPAKTQKTKAVLVTSSNSGYYESLRNLYWEHSTVTGEVIGFFQLTHEEYQKNEDMHNLKLWAEIYLLSLTDSLVTSSWSTIGYVAQSLAGINPLILYKPEEQPGPDEPCRGGLSMEPCFLAPPLYDCNSKMGVETNSAEPYVRRCEDTSRGVKLVDGLSDDIS